MAGIRGRNTKPELALRSGLHRLGFRFRLHQWKLPGRPDLVLRKYRAAIFVHGCFWHRHPGCVYTTKSKTRPEFWKKKLSGNVERDARNLAALKQAGWRTAVVWECGFKNGLGPETIGAVADWLLSSEPEFEAP